MDVVKDLAGAAAAFSALPVADEAAQPASGRAMSRRPAHRRRARGRIGVESRRRRCGREAVARLGSRRAPALRWGADHYLKTGITARGRITMLPENFDAILLGAMGIRAFRQPHAADILLGLRHA